jgi:hypothetical protein
MIKGKTKSGFEFEMNEEVLNDMRIVDALADMQSGDDSLVMVAVTELLNLVLGRKQKQLLYKHLEVENGRVPIEKVSDELVEIFNSLKEGKN